MNDGMPHRHHRNLKIEQTVRDRLQISLVILSQFNPFMHVWPFYNIMHERIKQFIFYSPQKRGQKLINLLKFAQYQKRNLQTIPMHLIFHLCTVTSNLTQHLQNFSNNQNCQIPVSFTLLRQCQTLFHNTPFLYQYFIN